MHLSFIDALLICFNVGLLWMLALVLIAVRREQGSLAWLVVHTEPSLLIVVVTLSLVL